MLIGYARVSTNEQSLDLQLDALKQAGCERLFDETTSGVNSERPGLGQALAYLREGDELVRQCMTKYPRPNNPAELELAAVRELYEFLFDGDAVGYAERRMRAVTA